MKIPSGDKKRDRAARLKFVEDLRDKCLVSREERRQYYASNRLFYLYGTDGSYENEDIETGLGPPPGNKIYPHIDQLTSFLYAQETTRFGVEIDTTVDRRFLEYTPQLGQLVNDEWHHSNTDIMYGLALTWAMVYGSTFVKPIWRRNGIWPHIVLPHNFGVLREDIPMLSRQEAFVHCYSMTRSQLRNELQGHPKLEEILDQVQQRSDISYQRTPGLDRILMSAQDPLTGGAGSGVIDWLSSITAQYQPRVSEEMIDLYELYVWDDALGVEAGNGKRRGDWRVFTIADPAVVIFDRPQHQMFLRFHEPFVQICPNLSPDYFWGISEVERLAPLQKWRNQRMAQIQHLLTLSAHPPSKMAGFPGEPAEIQYTLDTPYGLLNQPDPAGVGGQVQAERVQIEVPNDLFAEINMIDGLFEEMSGITNVMSGKGEQGVRSQGHASQLARLGASRAKKRALIIEDSLEGLATLYLKLLQKYDDSRLVTDKGEPFIAEQFTDSYRVTVDAHSNSPIFVEDHTQLAFELLKAKAITRERLLELLPVPMRQLLLRDLKDQIEPAEAKAAKEAHDLELAKIQRGEHHARPKAA